MQFVSTYMQLMDVYEARCEALHASVDAACDALVAQSRIPELAEDGLGGGWGVGDRRADGSQGGRPDGRREEGGGGGGGGRDGDRTAAGDGGGDGGDGGDGSGSGDDDEEDLEVLQRRVRRKFVAAMEQLQCARLPKRRRGNLPKEATAVFRSWFAANLDHPYPTDAVKADLSRATGTGVAQVSNWLINYRYVRGDGEHQRLGEDGLAESSRRFCFCLLVRVGMGGCTAVCLARSWRLTLRRWSFLDSGLARVSVRVLHRLLRVPLPLVAVSGYGSQRCRSMRLAPGRAPPPRAPLLVGQLPKQTQQRRRLRRRRQHPGPLPAARLRQPAGVGHLPPLAAVAERAAPA